MLDRREFGVGEEPLDRREQRRVVLRQGVCVGQALDNQVLGNRRQHRREVRHVRDDGEIDAPGRGGNWKTGVADDHEIAMTHGGDGVRKFGVQQLVAIHFGFLQMEF